MRKKKVEKEDNICVGYNIIICNNFGDDTTFDDVRIQSNGIQKEAEGRGEEKEQTKERGKSNMIGQNENSMGKSQARWRESERWRSGGGERGWGMSGRDTRTTKDF